MTIPSPFRCQSLPCRILGVTAGQPRTLTYAVVIPPGTAGRIEFQGTASADGIRTVIVSDDSLRVWESPPQPLCTKGTPDVRK
ncbi:MAG TPA: hypothetical protein PK640_21755 [Verrucomicrobiota bacterium]|nr:hypothetical protein [Verrucomicrobiota bacterium]